MNQGRYVFNQLCDFLPKAQFDWFVKKYQGNCLFPQRYCQYHVSKQCKSHASFMDTGGQLNRNY